MKSHGSEFVFVEIPEQKFEFVLDLCDMLGLEVEESLQVALDRQQVTQDRHPWNHYDVFYDHPCSHEVHQAKHAR